MAIDWKKLFPNGNETVLAQCAETMDAVCAKFEINTPRRLAYFLAQIAHESGGFRFFEENLNYSAPRLLQIFPRYFNAVSALKCSKKPELIANKVYGGRMGNVDAGDGWKYRGRGAIQLTGRNNYKLIGSILGFDLENNPDQASKPHFVLATAGAFWKANDLNRYADIGDFAALTRRINGGLNGQSDRLAYLSKITRSLEGKRVYGVAELTTAQINLRNLGYYEVGKADGVHGSRTTAAIAAFQHENDLPISGELDEETNVSLETSPERRVVSEARATGAPDNSRILKGAKENGAIGISSVLAGGLSLAQPILDNVQAASDFYKKTKEAVEPFIGLIAEHWGIALVAVGGLLIWRAGVIYKSRLEDHRTGKTA